MKLEATIPGPPATWQRPRRGEGGKGAFTTTSMRKAKAHARAALAAEALRARWAPATCPLQVTIECVRNRKPDARPDGDNLAKLVLDAANGVLWDDDARVVDLRVIKRRPEVGEVEHTRVVVEAVRMGLAREGESPVWWEVAS